MKILGYIVLLIILISFLISWVFYRDELKGYLGIPVIAKVGGSTPSKENKTPHRAPKVIQTSPTPKPGEEGEKETIHQLLAERYPLVIAIPFSEKFPSIEEVPASLLPPRIQTNQSVNFTIKDGAAILAASFVKSGGMVQPLKVTSNGESLEICSLADSNLKSVIPVTQTDFLDRIQQVYEDTQQEAIQRIQEIWKTDALLLQSNSRIFEQLKRNPTHWDVPDAPGYRRYYESINNQLNPDTHRVTGFFTEGKNNIQTEDHSGIFSTIAARIEGADEQFNSYIWRARGIIDKGRIIQWIGLPE